MSVPTDTLRRWANAICLLEVKGLDATSARNELANEVQQAYLDALRDEARAVAMAPTNEQAVRLACEYAGGVAADLAAERDAEGSHR